MSDTFTLIPVLLAEGLLVALLALSLMIFLKVRNQRRKRRSVALLVSQISQQSKIRLEETGSFLRDIYQLEDTALQATIEHIDKQERIFFNKVIEMFLNDDIDLMTAMDATTAELIDTYKQLKPILVEGSSDNDSDDTAAELQALQEKHESLKEELRITNATMAEMIEEYGTMFGGGKDHDLAKHEVMGKIKSDSSDDDAE